MDNKTIMSMVLVLLIVLPIVNADIIIDSIDESSGVVFDRPLNIELKDAIVNISINEYSKGTLTATFEIMSKEAEEVNARLYLKAKGQSCANWGCEDIDVTEYTTRIKMYYKPSEEDKKLNPYVTNKHISLIKNGDAEVYLIEQEETLVVENEEGKFAGTREFNLVPGETLVVEIEQDITAPFKYYLDSLSTFSKVDYEKITIKGDNLTVEFNDKYPVKKISNNEWGWEYSNLNINDENLKDVLVIKKGGSSEPNPSNLIYYIGGAVILVILILLGFLIKKKK